jgi:SulP family sulfate permease
LKSISSLFLQPVQILRDYRISYLRSDLVAGLTVAVVMLPQAMAYAFIADLPPHMGLYSAVVGSVVGALWGSSNQLQTGPTNAASLLVLSTLLGVVGPDSPGYLAAASLMAVMVGGFRLIMGLARLGVLVNFVSDSVVVGFTAGAGVLIALNQVQHLLRLPVSSAPSVWGLLPDVLRHVHQTHWLSLIIGLWVVIVILVLRRVDSRLPAPLIGMVTAAGAVGLLGMETHGVRVIGGLPRTLPPLVDLSLFTPDLAVKLFTGSAAVAAIGLVEAISIARGIASQTGQHLDSNQEFVGQGLANIACGLFTGYTCSGSFSRSAVNHDAGAKTQLASIFAGLLLLMGILTLAPLAAYVPLAALAGVLVLTGYELIDREEIVRIWRGGNSDRVIMVATVLATLLLPLQCAVLTGIGLSIVYYLLDTSRPQVRPVKMSDNFRYFTPRTERPSCPQLAVLEILGDLYFGATSHIEERIDDHLIRHPSQRFLLLRMYAVENCDISGIHTLESIVSTCRARGGDVYFVHVQRPVFELMRTTGFHDWVGQEHFLSPDRDVSHLFYHVLDPAICVYECSARAFKECQNLPKQNYETQVEWDEEALLQKAPTITAEALWATVHEARLPAVIDVREPREFQRAHIPGAENIPLPTLLSDEDRMPRDQPVILVCRGGRRSMRAAATLRHRGLDDVKVLEGGMLAWEQANLLEAV